MHNNIMNDCLIRASVLMTLVCLGLARSVPGDTFGGGVNTFDIEFVEVGNPGNSAATIGFGISKDTRGLY